jgi:UDP-glucose 4-epimerase
MSDFWTGRRVLVAGGLGMIGSHVVEHLLEEDVEAVLIVDDCSIGELWNLTCFAGKSTKATPTPPFAHPDRIMEDGRVYLQYKDVLDWEYATSPVADVEVIINLASPAWGLGAPQHMLHAVNFHRTLQPHLHLVKEAINGMAVSYYFVAGSSCEMSQFDQPEAIHSGYGWAKRMIDHHLEWSYSNNPNRPLFTSIKGNMWNVFGPRENEALGRATTDIIRRVLKSPHGAPIQIWGSGEQVRNYLYVEDCARKILESIESSGSIIPHFLPVAIKGVDLKVCDLANNILAALDSPRDLEFMASEPEGFARKGALVVQEDPTLTPIYTGMRETAEWIKDYMQ